MMVYGDGNERGEVTMVMMMLMRMMAMMLMDNEASKTCVEGSAEYGKLVIPICITIIVVGSS